MRIGINCCSVNPAYKGGLNTYVFGLLDGFYRVGTEHQFQLYVSLTNRYLFARFESLGNFELITIESGLPLLVRVLRRLAPYSRSLYAYKKLTDKYSKISGIMDSGSDIVYTPTTVLIAYNHSKPTVLSMHDIQHFHYPQFFAKYELLVRKMTCQLSADYADYFQASSNFIKEDLLSHFPNLRENQIVVIPEGVDTSKFTMPQDTASLELNYGIPDKYLFFPAQLWPHKNHITLLKALKRIENEQGLQIPLVLTGAKYSAAESVFDFIASNHMSYVFYLGLVPFEDIPSLYRQAAFLVTAVLYESSSLPILEAAAAGTPIIASWTPPNEEVGKILMLNLFDPLDVSALADLILRLWGNESATAEQVRHNKKHIVYYSWDNAARRYLNFFSEILADRERA